MERFIKGDVVVLPFPFSDLSNSKKRPALVLSVLEGDDIILCQITSQFVKDNYAIVLDDSGFKKGSFNLISNIRPNRLFTAARNIINYKVGSVNPDIYDKVVQNIIKLIKR
jgi:mRNA interferase MazF